MVVKSGLLKTVFIFEQFDAVCTTSAEDELIETDARGFRDFHFEVIDTDSAIHYDVVLVDVKLRI